MKRFWRIPVAILTGVVMVCLAGEVAANEKIGLVPARPDVNQKESFSRFLYQLTPGESRKNEVAVVNLTEDELVVNLSVAGGQDWIRIASGSGVRVPARERVRVPFEVEVPGGVDSGEYLLEIVGDIGGRVEVLVTVKGEERKEMTVESVDRRIASGTLGLKLRGRNSGNVSLSSMSMRVRLKNLWGVGAIKEAEYFFPIEGKFKPGEEIEIELAADKRLPFIGKYQGSYELDMGGVVVKAEMEEFVYINFVRLGGYLLVVGTGVAGVIFGVIMVVKLLVSWVIVSPRERARREWQKKKDLEGKILEEMGVMAGRSGINKEELLKEIRLIVREEIEAKWKSERGAKKKKSRIYTLR